MFASQEQTAFTFILILFVGALITTLLSADERRYIPSKRLSNSTIVPQTNLYLALENGDVSYDDFGYETGSNGSQEDSPPNVSYLPSRTPTPTMDNSLPVQVTKKTYNVHDHLRSLTSLQKSIRAFVTWPLKFLRSFTRILQSFSDKLRMYVEVPLVFRKLFVADFCSWTALMCHNMFYTDYVGQAIYGGNPNAEESSVARRFYDAGVRMGSWGLLLHSITCKYSLKV